MAIPQDLRGSRLDAVEELLFAPTDEPELRMREAICLRFGARSLVIEALASSSELRISLGNLAAKDRDYLIRNASEEDCFRRCIGKSLRNWWKAHNDQGYADVFMIALETTRGLCFAAMNNEVSVLEVAGEQWS